MSKIRWATAALFCLGFIGAEMGCAPDSDSSGGGGNAGSLAGDSGASGAHAAGAASGGNSGTAGSSVDPSGAGNDGVADSGAGDAGEGGTAGATPASSGGAASGGGSPSSGNGSGGKQAGFSGALGQAGAPPVVVGGCQSDGTKIDVTATGATAYILAIPSEPSFGGVNAPVTLCRGKRYTFVINTADHPFYIKTSATNGTADAYADGVVGNGSEGTDVVFSVPAGAPNTLYYRCSLHATMGGEIDIID